MLETGQDIEQLLDVLTGKIPAAKYADKIVLIGDVTRTADLVLIGVFGAFYIVPLYALVQLRSAPEQRALIGAVRELARDKDWRNQSIRYLDGTYPWENLNALADAYEGSEFKSAEKDKDPALARTYPTVEDLLATGALDRLAQAVYAPLKAWAAEAEVEVLPDASEDDEGEDA